MKKEIVVRKYKAERVCSWLLLVFIACTMTAACLLWGRDFRFFLLFLPILLPSIFVCLYYEMWQVSFGPGKITIKRLFLKTRTYAYHEIRDAYAAYSRTMQEHICVTFSDGKRITIRLKDVNAGMARRVLLSHHSIRASNWR